jgi:nitrogen fixation protein FixH
MAQSVRASRELSGRTVFLILLVFFGVVAGANFILMRAATTTFGGLETESSYKAGLAFKQEVSLAQAQNGRGWKVEANLTRIADSGTRIEIAVRDAKNQPIPRLDLLLTLSHPTDKRQDHTVAMGEVTAGSFKGLAHVTPGQWELVIALSHDGERMFRSQNRIVLK